MKQILGRKQDAKRLAAEKRRQQAEAAEAEAARAKEEEEQEAKLLEEAQRTNARLREEHAAIKEKLNALQLEVVQSMTPEEREIQLLQQIKDLTLQLRAALALRRMGARSAHSIARVTASATDACRFSVADTSRPTCEYVGTGSPRM